MPTSPYNLPRLSALTAFEAAARHLSFKKAAQELNVTPGAVSHQIRDLESDIGVPLFLRSPQGVSLTPDGESLYQTLTKSFSQIDSVVSRLRNKSSNPPVSLRLSTAFSSLWFAPRISSFWKEYPQVRVDQHITDDLYSLAHAKPDLCIHCGIGIWSSWHSELLFADPILPVCHPDFAKEHAVTSPADLLHLPLIHFETINPSWMGWEEWFQHADVQRGELSGIRIDNYLIALQVAQDGHGVVLGWMNSIEPLIRNGSLVPLPVSSPSLTEYNYVSWSLEKELSPSAITFRDWLIRNAR